MLLFLPDTELKLQNLGKFSMGGGGIEEYINWRDRGESKLYLGIISPMFLKRPKDYIEVIVGVGG